MDGFCKVVEMEKAKELWRDMISREIFPHYISFSILINGFCSLGLVSEAFRLWDEMKENGIRPTLVTNKRLFACWQCVKGKRLFEHNGFGRSSS